MFTKEFFLQSDLDPRDGLFYFVSRKITQKRGSYEVLTQISYQELAARNILYIKVENEVEIILYYFFMGSFYPFQGAF